MKKRIINIIVAALAALLVFGLVAAWAAIFNSSMCPSRRYFHVYCPGCGMTRAVLNLLQLNFIGAFKQNALFILILLYCVYTFGYFAINYIKTGKKQMAPIKPIVNIAFLIIIAVFTVLRNIYKF